MTTRPVMTQFLDFGRARRFAQPRPGLPVGQKKDRNQGAPGGRDRAHPSGLSQQIVCQGLKSPKPSSYPPLQDTAGEALFKLYFQPESASLDRLERHLIIAI